MEFKPLDEYQEHSYSFINVAKTRIFTTKEVKTMFIQVAFGIYLALLATVAWEDLKTAGK